MTTSENDNVILVTGAGNGLGREIAMTAAARGATVIVNDIDLESAETVADSINGSGGGTAFAQSCDVASEESVNAMADEVRRRTGRLDVLVNNAGIFELPVTPTVEQDVDRWQRIIDVCLRGTYLCSRRMAADFFLPQQYGRVVNISSISGVGGLPMRNAYSAAKAGVNMMTRTMASEWAASRVTVNSVAPGYIATDAFNAMKASGTLDDSVLRRRIPRGELGRPADIANAVLFLASRESGYITGTCLPVDGGWSAFGGAGDAFTSDPADDLAVR